MVRIQERLYIESFPTKLALMTMLYVGPGLYVRCRLPR